MTHLGAMENSYGIKERDRSHTQDLLCRTSACTFVVLMKLSRDAPNVSACNPLLSTDEAKCRPKDYTTYKDASGRKEFLPMNRS